MYMVSIASTCCIQTFSEAVRHHQHSMESEWNSEKEKILNSLLGSSQDLEFPSESEVGFNCNFQFPIQISYFLSYSIYTT